VQCSNKGGQIKSSNIFDQARTFSEKAEKKKQARYVSDSDSDSSDSDKEKAPKVKFTFF
jgi:hypothetical protein